jgi:hypothetical protein
MHPTETSNTFARFEFLTEVTIKAAVLRDMMPCNMVECDQCFEVTCCFHLLGGDKGNGGSRLLYNSDNILPEYTPSHPRKQQLAFFGQLTQDINP